MAKKKDGAVNMQDQFDLFNETKKIDKTTLITVMEESFRKVLSGMFGNDDNLDVIVNPDKGDCEIYQNLLIVPNGEVENPNKQISLSDAQADDNPDCEVGEEHTRKIDFAKFGRRAILNLRQTLSSKILELQKDAIYNKFKVLEGELISAEVYQLWKREVLLMDDEKNELLLPKDQQIPSDIYRKGDQVLAVIHRVENPNNNPKVIVSRTSDEFLRRLFEREVPEIHDGLIVIRAVARIPGVRAKIAVESYDDRIDPVGACVGVKGGRIHGIVRELRNENIDVIPYTSNEPLLIQRALSPAKITSIRLDREEKHAEVYVRPDEISLAIGARGLNIKLASDLTGYVIDVYRDIDTDNENDDIYLEEFKDEIDDWVIDAIKNAGFNTAKALLMAPPEEVIEKADLEESTVHEVLQVVRAEFDKE